MNEPRRRLRIRPDAGSYSRGVFKGGLWQEERGFFARRFAARGSGGEPSFRNLACRSPPCGRPLSRASGATRRSGRPVHEALRFPDFRTLARGKIVDRDDVAGRERRNGPHEALTFPNPKTRLSNSVRTWGLGTQIGEPNGGSRVRGGDHFVPRLRVRLRKRSAVV